MVDNGRKHQSRIHITPKRKYGRLRDFAEPDENDPESGEGSGKAEGSSEVSDYLKRRNASQLLGYIFIALSGASWLITLDFFFRSMQALLDTYATVSVELSKQELESFDATSLMLLSLPVFSLSVFLIVFFVALARFTKHFIAGSSKREADTDDQYDDNIILAALDRIFRHFSSGSK